MSTYITVTSDSNALVDRVKKVQFANRDALLESEHDAKFQERAEAELTQARAEADGPLGGNPDTSINRRPAAHRSGSLQPFAISWKGVFSGGYNSTTITVLDSYTVFGISGTLYDLITSTHSGLRQLSPSPIRFATKYDSVSSTEAVRLESWRTTVETCVSSRSSTACELASNSLTTQFPNRWLTDARQFYSDDWTPVLPAPAIDQPVGPTTYTPTTSIVTVDVDGTVYLIFSLPDAPSTLTSYSISEYTAAGYPGNAIRPDDYVDLSWSYAYDPWRGNATLIYLGEQPKRYIFIKATSTTTESTIAVREVGENLGQFLYDNMYATDPSRAVRSEGYLGEYRIRNTSAKFLRLRNADGDYSAFPYNFLQDYKDENSLPDISGAVRFEDFTYRIDPTASASELAAQLTALSSPTTSTASVSRTRIPTNKAVFLEAKLQLGSDPGEEITPYLYIAIGQ